MGGGGGGGGLSAERRNSTIDTIHTSITQRGIVWTTRIYRIYRIRLVWHNRTLALVVLVLYSIYSYASAASASASLTHNRRLLVDY